MCFEIKYTHLLLQQEMNSIINFVFFKYSMHKLIVKTIIVSFFFIIVFVYLRFMMIFKWTEIDR